MPLKLSSRTPKWVLILVVCLLLATTVLAVPALEARRAAAQAPDLLLPLVTGDGQAEHEAPDTSPAAPIGDSRDTNSGDTYQAPADTAAVNGFNATQWTVQNNVGVGTDAPTSDIDLSRNVNNYTRIWVRNPNAGGNAQSQLALTTASSYSVSLQQFGSGFSASWNGKSLKNMARLRTSPTDTGLIITTGGAAPLILGTADQERLRITPDGKVGIGTTTPAHQLSIARGPNWTTSSWGGSIALTNGGAIGWHNNVSGISFGMGHTNNGFHFFSTLDDPGTTGPVGVIYAMTFTDFGRVGIGTAVPDAKLHVVGDVKIDGVLYVNGTPMSVPDYVFEPEYSLMSLDELRAYVDEEKHLPNLPDAEQIAQNGLNVTDFQMKLLEKTEELTLYTLAQDEQLQSQQQEIESLREENEAMQKVIADLVTRLAALEEQQ